MGMKWIPLRDQVLPFSAFPRRIASYSSSERLICRRLTSGNDLDQDDHDDRRPHGKSERVQQVGQQPARLRRRRRPEQIAGDVDGEPQHKRCYEDLVQDPRPVGILAHLREVLSNHACVAGSFSKVTSSSSGTGVGCDMVGPPIQVDEPAARRGAGSRIV